MGRFLGRVTWVMGQWIQQASVRGVCAGEHAVWVSRGKVTVGCAGWVSRGHGGGDGPGRRRQRAGRVPVRRVDTGVDRQSSVRHQQRNRTDCRQGNITSRNSSTCASIL